MVTSRLLPRTAPSLCLLAILAFTAGAVHADTLTFNFLPTNTFSGTAPAGTLTVDFLQVSGGVQMTITSHLAPGENLQAFKALYLNFDPSLNVRKLDFALQSFTGGFSQAADVDTAANSFKAGGDGYYDILFAYAPSTKAFTNGESQTYLITDPAATLTAADFDFGSVWSQSSYLAAIHVQNTPSGGEGSAWVAGTPGTPPVTTSEPGSLALLGVGLVGLSAFLRKLSR